MTEVDSKAPSMFAQLSDVASHQPSADDGESKWTMTRGITGFAPFAEAVSSVRTGDGEGNADTPPAVRFSESADTFLSNWMRKRHGSAGHAGDFVIGIDDPSRIWAARLLTVIESANGATRSRLNFIHDNAQGGSLSLNYVQMNDIDSARLHVYSADARERTASVAKTVDVLHTSCDFLIQLIGPMEPKSFDLVATRVRRLLAEPGRRLKMVLFVVSPSAARLRPALEALGAELGVQVGAVQGNLAEMEQVWRSALGCLGGFVADNPEQFSGVAEAHAAPDSHATAVTGSATDLHELAAMHALPADVEQDMLRAFLASDGVRWVAILNDVGAVDAMETDVHEQALAAVNAVVQLLQADPTDSPAEEFFAETSSSVTLAQPLANSSRWFAVQFDKTTINQPLARLLAARMVAELDA
jgi:hypothetical protein